MYCITIGTGRCGTLTVAKIFSSQSRLQTNATHEGYLLPWAFDAASFDAYAEWIEGRSAHPVHCDAGFYLLPYAEALMGRFPGLKVVVVERPRAEVVASYERWVPQHDHWRPHDGSLFERSHWDACYPKFQAGTRREAIGLYWDLYRAESDRLIREHPGRVMKMGTADLNREDRVRAMLEFCGFEDPEIRLAHENKAKARQRPAALAPLAEESAIFHCPHGVDAAIRRVFFEHVAPEALANTGEAREMGEITVATYNNRPRRCLIERQAERLRLARFEVLSRGALNWSWMEKVRAPLEAIRSGRIKTKYLLLTDGDDSIFAICPVGGDLIALLAQSGGPALFGATSADWPPSPEIAEWERRRHAGTVWAHLTASGCLAETDAFAAYAEEILRCYEETPMAMTHGGRFDDQKAWRWLRAAKHPEIAADIGRSVFCRFDPFVAGDYWPW